MFDLRAAITQMQLDRARSPLRVIDQFDGINESSPVDELAQLVRRLDVLSFTDAFVAPPMWARIEVGGKPQADSDARLSKLIARLRDQMTKMGFASSSSLTCRTFILL